MVGSGLYLRPEGIPIEVLKLATNSLDAEQLLNGLETVST